MSQRITKKEKQIINDILVMGLGEFWYGDAHRELKLNLCINRLLFDGDIDACLDYIFQLIQ